jgi:anion-transporting  ArsA/GET3 family ATPase
VLICTGSGGVGKTTISAGLALRACELGLKVLVLTVDPAQRLMTSLGLEPGSDEIREVKVAGQSGQLFAGIVQSKKVFDDFILKHAGNADIIQRIFKNRLYQQLSTTLSGSQEFTALEKLLQEYETAKYDLIILDTPPTKHALDFFMAPRRIKNLFQDSITKWFAIPNQAPQGFVAGLFYRGTRTVFKSLEVLTGGQFIEELIDFFAAVKSIQVILRDRSQLVENILGDVKTQFILITSFDAAKLEEAKHMQEAYAKMNYRLDAVIINRAFPIWMPNSQSTIQQNADSDYLKILKFYQEFKNYYSARYKLYEDFARQIKKEVQIYRIPEYGQDVCGIEDLLSLAARLAQAQNERSI